LFDDCLYERAVQLSHNRNMEKRNRDNCILQNSVKNASRRNKMRRVI